MRLAFLILYLFASGFSWAYDKPALQVSVSYENDLGPELRQQLTEIVPTAVNFVGQFPPKGYDNNLFQWIADREILKGKSLSLVVTTSKNPTLAPLIANSGSSNMDSFTMSPINFTDKTMAIIVVLLADKIFYDGAGREARGGFSRLVLALAHEIYGNVQHFLEFNIENVQPQTRESRINQQKKSYQASIMFLGGVIESEKFPTLPPRVRDGLLSLLPKEIEGLRSWQ